MPSQLGMLERWTEFTRRRCQFETRERDSEVEDLKMKQMKAEEPGMLVRWTTETRRRSIGRLRKQHVRKKHAEPAEMLERWTKFARRARKRSRRRKLQHAGAA